MSEWAKFQSFLDQVGKAKERLQLRQHQEAFYRGHGDVGYRLLPSLYRQLLHNGQTRLQLERRMFFDFRNHARQLYDSPTDWDVLFHMQHHGVPTRLLDWTSTFGVALYFALLNYRVNSARRPCVWVLNPYALNDAVWGVPRLFNPKYLARDEKINRSYDFGELLIGTRPQQWVDGKLWETPMAIYSHQRSERMFAQNGCFTIQGEDPRPIDEIFNCEGQKTVEKVEIPQEAISAGREFLSFAGIGHHKLFPDLDGIARSVCERHLSAPTTARALRESL